MEAPTRAATPVVVWDDTHDLVKINPLVAWSDEDVEAYQVDARPATQSAGGQGLPIDRLRPVHAPGRPPGEDPRAGRWAGKAKTECGIHT